MINFKHLRLGLFCTIILTCQNHSFSQTKNFGIKGGFNSSTVQSFKNEETHQRLGYHIGIVGNVKLGSSWVLQPEIIFSNQGYGSNSPLEVRYNYHYINVPFLFKYQYRAIFFYFGPQVGLLFNATKLDLKTNKREDITPKLNPLAASATTGFGFMASENIGFDIRYSADVLSMSGDSDEMYNHVVQISFIYVLK